MKFYSTNNPAQQTSLREAVIQGLAPDNGLYMPEQIPQLPADFVAALPDLSPAEIAFTVAQAFVQNDVPAEELRRIVEHTVNFDVPLAEVEHNVHALELFHGPTLAFKDFGARFMSQLLGYFAREQEREIVILVATSGDTGSAVANGFLGVAGTRVIVLYPSGKVSDIQEKQFTTLGQNITALEVDGTFDDCQRLVKQAFLDETLRAKHFLTSANSINIARLIPQSFYYFHAYARVAQRGLPVVFAVPSGNFGNLTAGLLAKRMGLPIDTFIAATNANDIVPDYLHSGIFNPRPSQQTISNAMDVGNPSNFARMLDLYGKDINKLRHDIKGYRFSDDETRSAMRAVYGAHGYTLDPHGAVGYAALKQYQRETGRDVSGVFLETAHPAKFKEVVDATLPEPVRVPAALRAFLSKEKKSVRLGSDFRSLKDYLLMNV